MKILIVEDNFSTQELLDSILQMEGHKVNAAMNGKEALTVLAHYSFDLIVSDIRMPVMDGIEFGFQLRKLGIHTPIIFFSAEVNGLAIYAKRVEQIGGAEFIENKDYTNLLGFIRMVSKHENG